jgi:dTDP-4-amino-4,6-dideoxygalactose transaminase
MWRELPPTAGLPLALSDLFSTCRPEELANGLARLFDVPSVQIECSGTAALIVALSYLKSTSKRHKVVVPGYTCPLVAIAVAQSGLETVVCDTQPHSYDFDPGALASCVDEDTLAVIPTHIGGFPADLNACAQVARGKGAFIIEDAAQALGAVYDGRPVGTIGDIGMFSLTRGKGLSIYEGGFLVATDPQMRKGLEETSRRLSGKSAFTELVRACDLIGFAAIYNPVGLALTYAPYFRSQLKKGNYDAALGDLFDMHVPIEQVGNFRLKAGASALKRFPAFLAENRQRGRSRSQLLSAIKALRVMHERPGDEGSWPFITVVFDDAQACRQALDKLWMSGMGVTKLFGHALTHYGYLRSLLGLTGSAENAESLAARSLTVTNGHWLSSEEFEHICSTLEDACRQTQPRNFHQHATL